MSFWHQIWSLFEESAILRLFVVMAVGYLLGEVRLPGNFRFGLVAVLIVGLGFGALSPQFTLPAELQTLGLVLFVYCVGLEVAPGFMNRLKRDGLRLNLAAAAALLLSFGICWLLIRYLDMPRAVIAGLFCGSLTNTPALAAVTESLTNAGQPAAPAIVGYALAYPFAVIGLLLLIQLRATLTGGLPAHEKKASMMATTFQIQSLAPDGLPWTVGQLRELTSLILTRCKTPEGTVQMAGDETRLPPGSIVVAVGTTERIQGAAGVIGTPLMNSVVPELGGLETHRYFVSNPAIVGRPLTELQLWSHGTIVSRIRRGDVDMPVTPASILLLGDRVRALSTPENEPAVRKFFGNSLQILTETGYITFALGITLGLFLGAIPIPIPGLEQPVKLGAAGGPLIVALILGARGRTGPLIWSLPFTVNLALRQLGLLLFFAAVGVKAGVGLRGITDVNVPLLAALGAGLMIISHLLLWGFLARSKPKLEEVLGASAAMQTQPAALSFSERKVGSPVDLNAAYATIYPVAIILKIVLAQLLLL